MSRQRKSAALNIRGKRRLLLIDDDAAVRQTLVMMGNKLGADVQPCSNLAEFEAGLQSFEPDVLLIDLMMPDVDGIDVISAINPDCKAAIYVITGADKRTIEASREVLEYAGAKIAGFLHKPFAAADLRLLVDGADLQCASDAPRLRTKFQQDLLSPAEFKQAVCDNRVEPYFQPIFHADKLRLKGFEALLRVEGEKCGSFAPQYLQQMVGDDELADRVTRIVIEKSLRFLASLPAGSDLTISINVFGAHAIANGFRDSLVKACELHQIERKRVILELSEATIFELDDEDFRKMTQLRLAGFGLSIDDFGTGNSSLGRLARLPFSELKIDKSFCSAMPLSDSARAVIEACLGLARKLDMTVTAEGVETLEVAVILAEMGCHALQGHYFGAAMPPREAARQIGNTYPKAVA